MIESDLNPTDLYIRHSRRSMIATLIAMILIGVTLMAITLTPNGAAWRAASLGALALVATAAILLIHVTVSRRRWSSALPEVQVAEEDEWQQNVTMRASRATMIVMLCAEWPLAILIGFLAPAHYGPPRVAMAMAGATITLGVVTQLAMFLYLDRDES